MYIFVLSKQSVFPYLVANAEPSSGYILGLISAVWLWIENSVNFFFEAKYRKLIVVQNYLEL